MLTYRCISCQHIIESETPVRRCLFCGGRLRQTEERPLPASNQLSLFEDYHKRFHEHMTSQGGELFDLYTFFNQNHQLE